MNLSTKLIFPILLIGLVWLLSSHFFDPFSLLKFSRQTYTIDQLVTMFDRPLNGKEVISHPNPKATSDYGYPYFLHFLEQEHLSAPIIGSKFYGNEEYSFEAVDSGGVIGIRLMLDNDKTVKAICLYYNSPTLTSSDPLFWDSLLGGSPPSYISIDTIKDGIGFIAFDNSGYLPSESPISHSKDPDQYRVIYTNDTDFFILDISKSVIDENELSRLRRDGTSGM